MLHPPNVGGGRSSGREGGGGTQFFVFQTVIPEGPSLDGGSFSNSNCLISISFPVLISFVLKT